MHGVGYLLLPQKIYRRRRDAKASGLEKKYPGDHSKTRRLVADATKYLSFELAVGRPVDARLWDRSPRTPDLLIENYAHSRSRVHWEEEVRATLTNSSVVFLGTEPNCEQGGLALLGWESDAPSVARRTEASAQAAQSLIRRACDQTQKVRRVTEENREER